MKHKRAWLGAGGGRSCLRGDDRIAADSAELGGASFEQSDFFFDNHGAADVEPFAGVAIGLEDVDVHVAGAEFEFTEFAEDPLFFRRSSGETAGGFPS